MNNKKILRMEDYNHLIRTWHIKASEEDYFSKFVFEYLAFISCLRKKLYPNEKSDRKAIQKLKKNANIKEKYLNRVKEPGSQLNKKWDEIIKELDNKPLRNDTIESMNGSWWNCSGTSRCSQKNGNKESKVGVIHSFDDWENMVEFWYTIRNNLFHGEKDPGSERDQWIVEYGYFTLRELMEILLNENSNFN